MASPVRQVPGMWNFVEDYIARGGFEPTFWDKPGGAGRRFKVGAASSYRSGRRPSCIS